MESQYEIFKSEIEESSRKHHPKFRFLEDLVNLDFSEIEDEVHVYLNANEKDTDYLSLEGRDLESICKSLKSTPGEIVWGKIRQEHYFEPVFSSFWILRCLNNIFLDFQPGEGTREPVVEIYEGASLELYDDSISAFKVDGVRGKSCIFLEDGSRGLYLFMKVQDLAAFVVWFISSNFPEQSRSLFDLISQKIEIFKNLLSTTSSIEILKKVLSHTHLTAVSKSKNLGLI